MLEASFELFVPLVVANMVDVGIANGSVSYVVRMGGLLLLLAIIGLTCSLTAQYFAAKAATATATALRNNLFSHIGTLSYTEIDTIGTSTLITRMTSDINQVQDYLRSVEGVASVGFTTKEQALANFQSTSSDIVDALDGSNPLPASIEQI